MRIRCWSYGNWVNTATRNFEAALTLRPFFLFTHDALDQEIEQAIALGSVRSHAAYARLA